MSDRPNIAQGYRQGSTPERTLVAATWNNTGAVAGSGGLVSTGTDMAAFTAALLGYGPSEVNGCLQLGQQPVAARGVETTVRTATIMSIR